MTTEQRLEDARARRDRALVLCQEIQQRTKEQRQEARDAYNVIHNECLAIAAEKAANKTPEQRLDAAKAARYAAFSRYRTTRPGTPERGDIVIAYHDADDEYEAAKKAMEKA